MSPIYMVLAGGAILYLLTKKAEAQMPPPAPGEMPLTPEEGGELVVPEPEALPVGTTALLRFGVQTPGGTVSHFIKDENSWNGRKSSGPIVAGTSFSSLDSITADGRFQVTQVVLPPGYR